MRMQNLIKTYHVVQELWAFSLSAKERTDKWTHRVIIVHTCGLCNVFIIQSKKEGKDQESVQSSTTSDPGYKWGLYIGFRETGYLPFYFQGYRILSILLLGIWDTMFNIFGYFQGYWLFKKINYWDICQFIRDTCLFTSRVMGYLVPPYTSLTNGKVTTSQLDFTNESQEVSPFPAGDHKASINRRVRKHNKIKTEIT